MAKKVGLTFSSELSSTTGTPDSRSGPQINEIEILVSGLEAGSY